MKLYAVPDPREMFPDEPPQDILRTTGHSIRMPGVLSEEIEVRRIPVDHYEISALETLAVSLRSLGITPATVQVLTRLTDRWKQAA